MSKTGRQDKESKAKQALTAIRLVGFKSFRDPVDVEIRPLTLLAGANSGGKSSLIQPLLIMKQTFEAPFDPAPLLLDGPLFKVEHARTLFWKGRRATDQAQRISVELQGEGYHERTHFARSAGSGGVRLEGTEDCLFGVLYREEMTKEEIARALGEDAIVFERTGLLSKIAPIRDRATYALGILDSKLLMSSSLFRSMHTPELLADLIHLPGLRGRPERSYPITRADSRFPGPFQNYTAGVMLSWKEARDPRLKAVGQDLQHLGLAWKVDPRQRGDTAVEVQIGRLPRPQQAGAEDLVNIADVGFGASQVLPVLIALQTVRPGQVLHIEQPELHLHPLAQRKMADLIANAAKRGATVIIETHSNVLLRAVQLLVARGDLPASDVALHWFERDQDGASSVRSGKLDAAGAYGDWPVDFADVEMQVEREYIDAAFRKEG